MAVVIYISPLNSATLSCSSEVTLQVIGTEQYELSCKLTKISSLFLSQGYYLLERLAFFTQSSLARKKGLMVLPKDRDHLMKT